jgi:DNA-binding MarR family transcriptional regulator
LTLRKNLNLGDYLPYLVNRLGTAIAEAFTQDALREHRLTIAMWRVLVVLWSTGGQRQIDLAALTSIDASTLSRLVSRLVRMGLVTRTRSANSNREVLVRVTPKGRAIIARLVPLAKRYEAAANAGVTAGEVEVVKRCLRRMHENMARLRTLDSRLRGNERIRRGVRP